MWLFRVAGQTSSVNLVTSVSAYRQSSYPELCALQVLWLSNTSHELSSARAPFLNAPPLRGNALQSSQQHAISIEIGKLEIELKGPGHWKMNCSLLENDEYVNSVTQMLALLAAEGRKELTDCRGVWDWIKYNVRTHAINYSKKKPRKEMTKKKISKTNLGR